MGDARLDASDLSAFWATGHGWGLGHSSALQMSARSGTETESLDGWEEGTQTVGIRGPLGRVEKKRRKKKASGRDVSRILQGSHSCDLSLTMSDSQESVCIRQLPLHRKLLLKPQPQRPGPDLILICLRVM